jgi:hypothetical protein
LSSDDSTIVAKPPEKPTRPLRPREQAFVHAYADPASSTFGNGTQSYLVVAPDVGYDTARSSAVRMLANDSVSTSICDILNKANMGLEVRVDSIRRIISHKDIGRTVSKVRHTEDETITTTESGPGYRDVLKAVDVLNKVDGLYDRNRAAADIASTEYRSLVKRFFSTMDKGPRRAKAGGGHGSPTVLDVSLLPSADKNIEGDSSPIENSDKTS